MCIHWKGGAENNIYGALAHFTVLQRRILKPNVGQYAIQINSTLAASFLSSVCRCYPQSRCGGVGVAWEGNGDQNTKQSVTER